MKVVLEQMFKALCEVQNCISDDEFACKAESILQDLDLASQIDLSLFFDYIFSDDYAYQDLSPHRSGNIISLLETQKCKVMAHLWLDGVADLHTHEWSGAFQIVCGSALQVTYRYQIENTLDKFFVGSLDYIGTSMLRDGDSVRVVPGFELVHGISHLPRPSLALSVRRKSDHFNTAYDIRDTIAYPTKATPGYIKNLITLVVSSHAVSDLQGTEATRRVLKFCDLNTCFIFLKRLGETRLFTGDQYFGILEEWSHLSHENMLLASSLKAHYRNQDFLAIWQRIHDWEQRFFFSILHFLPDRDTIKREIRKIKNTNADDYILNHLQDEQGIFAELMSPLFSKVIHALYVFNGDIPEVFVHVFGKNRSSEEFHQFHDFCKSFLRSNDLEVLING